MENVIARPPDVPVAAATGSSEGVGGLRAAFGAPIPLGTVSALTTSEGGHLGSHKLQTPQARSLDVAAANVIGGWCSRARQSTASRLDVGAATTSEG